MQEPDHLGQLDDMVGQVGRYLVEPKEHVELPAWLDAIARRADGANILLLDRDGDVAYAMLDVRAYNAFTGLVALVAEILGNDDEDDDEDT